MPEPSETVESIETQSSDSAGDQGGIRETKGLKQSSDFIDNPTPDAASGAREEAAFDSDFEYLGTSGETGDPKKGEEGKGDEVKSSTAKEPPPKTEQPEIEVNLTPPPKEVATNGKDKEDLAALQSVKDKEIEGLRSQLATHESELKLLNDTKLALEEIKKEPLTFLYKQFPQLAKQIDITSYVSDKLKKEFGETFIFDGSEAYNPGTPSYNWRVREEELRHELRQSQLTAAADEERNTREREALLKSSKERVIKRYGLTEEQFQREVHDFSKTVVFDYDIVARLRFFDDIVKQAAKQLIQTSEEFKPKKGPKSPAGIGGGGSDEEQSSAYKEFSSEFGD